MQDLYQIVDDQDNLIGAKPRNEIDFEHDYYRISGLWLTNSKGQILLAQRLMTKDKDPGKWGPAAAGTLEVGETYESNMYKEAEEEIGLTGVDFKLGPKMKFTTPRHSFCQWFTAVSDKEESEFVPQPTEVECVKWIDEKEFFEDVRNNPDKYLPTMSLIVEALYPDEKG
ncbi:NUDIX domain-containing protein [Candidatus Saccharibacteria bacterium]|nr:NUDIX domain-containing protein [Candidatus Saccharibacteria bacterium]